jgi:D-xylose transport system ATP-binding protein
MSGPGRGENSSHRDPVLELRSIVKDFPGVRALDGVSFDLRAGEIHVLCGENGAGKSTLIKILCGLFPAGKYGGTVLLHGRVVQFRNVHAAEQHGIVLIAQELALVPQLSVEENIVLGREPTRFALVDDRRVRDTAAAALERVGLAIDPTVPMHRLGIAQQQMVEIAKALAKDASVLVLDEPTSALGRHDVQRLFELLRDLQRRGVASILVSHRLDEIFQVADRITVLRDGRSVATAAASDLRPDRVVQLMVGRAVADLYPRAETACQDVSLSVRDWTLAEVTRRAAPLLDGISFDVHRGEVLGVAGLMGAGRTALLASLYGAGRGVVHGELRLPPAPARAPFTHPAEAMRAGLALLCEDRKRDGLVAEASVGDNLVLATLRRFTRHGLIDARQRDREASDWIDRLHIKTPRLTTPVARLSGGNQQKTVFGRALMTRPRVLLLDEPTRGIDVGAKAEIYRLISDLAADGIAILLVTSELPELLGLSHRVLVLNQGRQTALLEGRAMTAEAVMRAATSRAQPEAMERA